MTHGAWLRRYSAVLMLFLLLGVGLHAQSVHGALAGTVTDSTGAVIPNAAVRLVNNDTGATYAQKTTSVGAYRFPELALGKYSVRVTADGFKSSITEGVLIQINTVTALDISLQPGSISEQVTVTSQGPSLQTESSDVGGVVSEKQITDLPLALGGVGQLRSPEAFVFLQPATAGPGTANSNNGIFLSKIAGGQNYGNEVLIDGVSQQRSENGSSFDEEAPSVEALQEFKVTTSLPQAQYDRTTGGIESFVTKSGTNSFHGTAYDIVRNQAFDANNYFNKGWRSYYCSGSKNTAACRKTWDTPLDHKNDYGGSFGGPVRIPKVYNGHDKTFFFFAWEQLKFNVGAVGTITVPTMAERQGDFSDRVDYTNPGKINPCDGTRVYAGQIFDPATTRTVTTSDGQTVSCRTAFPGNKINPTRFSNVAKALLSYWPEPTNSNVFGNYAGHGTAPIMNTTYSVRIDQNFSEKSKLWGSYNTRENYLITSGIPLIPDVEATNSGYFQDFTTHFFRVGWDYSLTPTLLNEVVFGTNRSNSKNYAQGIGMGVNWFQKLGIGNADSHNFPVIGTGDAAYSFGMSQNGDNVDNAFILGESITSIHGPHTFKFGGDLRMQQYSPISGNSPYLGFSSAETASATGGVGGGVGLASLFLGQVDNGSQYVRLRGQRWTTWYYGIFAQDDYKIRKDLTLNIGIRWDVDTPRHEAHNQTSNFSPTAIDPEYGIPGALVFGTQCKGCNTAWADTWFKDIAPRLGFAYSPAWLGDKTVIRGGAGIIYGPLQYTDFGGSMIQGYSVSPSWHSNDGFTPAFQLDSGYPAFAPPPNLDAGFFNGRPVSGSYIMKNAGRPATVYGWNLQVQHELAQDLLFTIGYMGNHAQNLTSNLLNPNNMPEKYFSLGNALWEPFTGNSAGIQAPFPQFVQNWGGNPQLQQALRPFPQYDYVDAGCCMQNIGMSSYNALTSTVQRRWKDGLNLQISYTWSKTFTDADSLLPNNGCCVVQDTDVNDLHKEKAISAQNMPHTLVLSGLYELPFGKGKPFFNHGIAAQLLGGWQIGSVQRFQSGQTVSFGCSWGIPGFQNCMRFNIMPGVSVKSAVYRRGAKHINPFFVIQPGQSVDPNVNTMFNLEYNNVTRAGSPVANAPIAFYDPNNNYARDCTTATLSNCNSSPNQPYRFGGVNNPRVYGNLLPLYFNNDASLMKRITLHEGYELSLKAEFMNTFNQHTFNGPNADPYNTGAFGMPTGTLNTPRQMQLTGRFRF